MVFGFDKPFPHPAGSFPFPKTPPDVDPDETPTVTVCFNEQWLPFVVGALQQLTLQSTWDGDDATILLAQSRAMDLLAIIGSENGGCGSSVCFDNVLYDPDTDTVKTSFDGGETYVDTPSSDPRHSKSFLKPPLTSDPQCQSAANAVANIKNLIDQVILIVDTAGDALGLIALITDILGIFIPLDFLLALIIDLATVMFSATASGLTSAFTTTTYDTLLCILYCNTEPDGTFTAGDLANIEAAIASDIGDGAQVVLDAMLLLMGEVGLSNMGIQGSATADCSACTSCGWIIELDFSSGNTNHAHVFHDSTFVYGTYTGDSFIGVHTGTPVELLLYVDLPATDIIAVSVYGEQFHGTGIGNALNTYDVVSPATFGGFTLESASFITSHTPDPLWFVIYNAGFTTTQGVGFYWVCDSNGTGDVIVRKVRISGTGMPPSIGTRVGSLT